MNEDEKHRLDLTEQITLGLDAEAFLNSKVGQYMQGRAEETAMEAMQSLKTVDPNDSKQVQALQNAVFRAESFMLWINQCMEEGRMAEKSLIGDE